MLRAPSSLAGIKAPLLALADCQTRQSLVSLAEGLDGLAMLEDV
jgi:hypothetical protein